MLFTEFEGRSLKLACSFVTLPWVSSASLCRWHFASWARLHFFVGMLDWSEAMREYQIRNLSAFVALSELVLH